MTAHAHDLIVERQDDPLDPGADLFLQDHLKTCAECRRYERTVAHVDRLLRMSEPALAVPSLSTSGAAHESQRALVAAAVVVVVLALGVFTGGALREFRSVDRLQGGSAPRAFARDACEIVERAAPLAGYPAGGSTSDHGSLRDTHACAYDEDFTDRWRDPHLVLVTRAVRSNEVSTVLDNIQVAPEDVEWREIRNGMWVTVVRPGATEPDYSFTAVAVFDEPYFFYVTERDAEKAERLAEAVRTVLRSR